jgi:hypothetical protein
LSAVTAPEEEEAGEAACGWRLSAFGLAVESDFAIPGAHTDDRLMPREPLRLTLVRREELEPLVRQPRVLRWAYSFDDCPYAMLEGADGDVLLFYGHRALFHVAADLRTLRCAPTEPDEPTWQRVLLDTVLWTVSQLRGYELLHASAVQTPAGVVAFLASSGGGKTTLAAEHMRRGCTLFCDDIMALEESGGHVLGSPGPPVMNLPQHLVGDFAGKVTVIGDFGEEQWVRLQTPPLSATRPAALVILERAKGGEARCAALGAPTSLVLLPHLAGLPDLPERTRRRFELCASIADTIPVLRLTADPSVPPPALADLVEEGLAGL